MNKFLLITKINILQNFNFSRGNNSKYKSEKSKKLVKTLGIMAIVGYIMWYVYYITSSLMPTFVAINKPLYMIAFLFVICTFYIMFTNTFRIKNILFDFKDYDLLMSLPIKRSSVIISKITALYITNLLYTLIVMIPGYVAYISLADMPNDILFFILLLTIPIIPILISSLLGIVITWISSFFKNKNLGSYIVNLLTIGIVLFISFKSGSLTNNSAELVNQSVNMIDSFGKYYPFTTLFVKLLEGFNFINMLIYFLIPIVLMVIFTIFINKGYTRLRTRLLKVSVKSNYKIKGYKSNGPLKGLYIKEIKKYISNSMYVLNTAFGCIMIIIVVIAMAVFNTDIIGQFAELSEGIKENIFLILSLFCALSSTTNASISLEGKSLWIMKSIPVSPFKIFMSKIMVNLTILVPTVLISATFFGIYLHLSLDNMILLYIMPLAYSLFISVLGLILNLLFPKFDFDNEMKVIKQSLPVFLTMIIGMLMVMLPFSLLNNKILITSVIVLIDIVLLIVLRYYGERKFRKL